jgi:hypothetical protein
MLKGKGPCYNLFLDDMRIPQEVFEYTQDHRYSERSWISVRNYEEFVQVVSEKYMEGQLPQLISFDHDLADQHYREIGNSDYDSYLEKTGYHCAKWFTDFCIDTDSPLPECLVHSMNPVGKKNIESLLKSFKCEYCDGEGYHKMSCVKSKNPDLY